jgi:hypothetical protein
LHWFPCDGIQHSFIANFQSQPNTLLKITRPFANVPQNLCSQHGIRGSHGIQ